MLVPVLGSRLRENQPGMGTASQAKVRSPATGTPEAQEQEVVGPAVREVDSHNSLQGCVGRGPPHPGLHTGLVKPLSLSGTFALLLKGRGVS